MAEIVIIGAGLAGLGAASVLEKEYAIYEKGTRPGGVCKSENVDGFIFDYGPHILYPSSEDMRTLVKTLLEGNLTIQEREAWIYHLYCDRLTRFPFQAHLFGLPGSVVRDCLMGVYKSHLNPGEDPQNYEEWMIKIFGEGIAKHMMIPYAKKIWTVSPQTMNYEWVSFRVPQLNYEDVLNGALLDQKRKFGFNAKFWYPVKNGIESLPIALAKSVSPPTLNAEATGVNIQKKYVEFNGSRKVYFEKLVSTIPLPDIVNLIPEAPADIKKAAGDLQHNSVLCVNVGVEREKINDTHWMYFYEDDFSFHRISFPMNFSSDATPNNYSSVSTEIAYSNTKLIDKKNITEIVINDLVKGKIIRPDDKIIASNVMDLKYAYIIYDLNHRKNVTKIHDYLLRLDIFPCGRFGEWEYFNMDHSIKSGMDTGRKLNALLKLS